MKMHIDRRNDLQNPVCEDSGVASGELGEPSCSGDCDGVACVILNGSKKENEEHLDPRYQNFETYGIMSRKFFYKSWERIQKTELTLIST